MANPSSVRWNGHSDEYRLSVEPALDEGSVRWDDQDQSTGSKDFKVTKLMERINAVACMFTLRRKHFEEVLHLNLI